MSDLQAANVNISLASFWGTYAFYPVVDGSFIVERPTVTLEKRRVNGVSKNQPVSYVGTLTDVTSGDTPRRDQHL